MSDNSLEDTLWVRYESSPVKVQSSTGTEHNLAIDLENGISAAELFPATSNTGKYVLKLSKKVPDVKNINSIKKDLDKTLKDLSIVWPFAAGSRMGLTTLSVITDSNYTTNADNLQKEMLARGGLTPFSTARGFPIETGATYSVFPLENASVLLARIRSDFQLYLMLDYLNSAHIDSRAWYIHLYKIKDTLQYAEEQQSPPNKRFGTSLKKWKKLRSTLNNHDLRHAPKTTEPIEPISRADRDAVFQIASEMINNYLVYHKLPHY